MWLREIGAEKEEIEKGEAKLHCGESLRFTFFWNGRYIWYVWDV
jgi:hypothetical protein